MLETILFTLLFLLAVIVALLFTVFGALLLAWAIVHGYVKIETSAIEEETGGVLWLNHHRGVANH